MSIDAEVIKKTQDTLGKYVKKPILSEKLLKKPPFRFLFDIINAVIRDTGYFDGLYTPHELNIENITDRDTKMQFLQKMIDALKLITNVPISVRTTKIVAGLEPEKTNEFLQMIGVVLENNFEWKDAVSVITSGDAVLSSKQKTKEKEPKEKKSSGSSPPKVPSTRRSDNSKEKSKEESKVKKTKAKTSRDDRPKKEKSPNKSDSDKKEEKIKSKSYRKEPEKKSERSKRSPVEDPKPELEPKIKSDERKKPKDENGSDTKPKESAKPNDEPNEEPELTEQETVRSEVKKVEAEVEPSPSLESKKVKRRASKTAEEILLAAAAEDTSGTESRRSSGKSRKSSAERVRGSATEDFAVKVSSESLKTVAEESSTDALTNDVKKSQSNPDTSQSSDVKRESTFVRESSKDAVQNATRPRTSLRPPSARPASARPGAPRRRDKNIEIILQPNDQVKLSGISVKLETFNSELEDDGENLVIIENTNTEDILEGSAMNSSKADEEESLQKGHLVQQILDTQKELVHGSSTDAEQKQETDMSNLNARQSSARQMNSLRDVIQNLTKSVNPLGKLMDFIPEDIDAMQLELAMWRDTYNQSSLQLKKERSLTESVTKPMKNQLVSIEATIKEYHEMIDGCRAKILQNAEKIKRLLTTQ